MLVKESTGIVREPILGMVRDAGQGVYRNSERSSLGMLRDAG